MRILIVCPMDEKSIKELCVKLPKDFSVGSFAFMASLYSSTIDFLDFFNCYLGMAENQHLKHKPIIENCQIVVGLCNTKEKFDHIVAYKKDSLIAQEYFALDVENDNDLLQLPFYTSPSAAVSFDSVDELNSFLKNKLTNG